jgi:hypothetical protein
MKNNKFIKLKPISGNFNYYINSMMICGMSEYDDHRVIHTIGGQVYNVVETYQEILKLIDDSEKITIINNQD